MRVVRIYLLLAAATATFAACATAVNDSGDGGLLQPPPGVDGSAAMDGTTTGPDGTVIPPPNDTGLPPPTDSGTPNMDTGMPVMDSSSPFPDVMIPIVDASGLDVTVPDVYVPPGSVACDYFAGNGSNLAKYIGECLVFQSFASPCASGCPSGTCCAALCTNNNQAVCLPQ